MTIIIWNGGNCLKKLTRKPRINLPFGGIVSLLLGIVASLIATYLYNQEISRWWVYSVAVLSVIFYVVVIALITKLLMDLKVMEVQCNRASEIETQLLECNKNLDSARESLRAKEIQIAKLKIEIEAAEETKDRCILLEEKIAEIESAKEAAADRERDAHLTIERLEADLGEQMAAGVRRQIENMTLPEFSETLQSNFVESSKVYVLVSRGYTLFGPQIEPFHTLFRQISTEEMAFKRKDVRIVLSNPYLNMERTRRIMELMGAEGVRDTNEVLATHFTTVREILRLADYCDLNLRIQHCTASWRVILFDDNALISSYRRVKKLPITVLDRVEAGLYEGFLYYFEKQYELSEPVTTLGEYKAIVKRSEEMIKKGETEFRLCLKNGISGI